MKHATHLGIVLSFALAGQAIAAEYVLDLKAADGQVSRYDEGRETIDDVKPSSVVRIFEPKMQTPKRGGFRVVLANQGQQPINLGPESITLKLDDGTVTSMFTYQQLVAEEKRRQTWQSIAAGLSAAGRNMQASSAGYSSGTASYSGNSFGQIGSTPYSSTSYGTGSYSGYNSSAAFAAQAVADDQNRREARDLAMVQAARLQGLEAVMKMTTVDPGSAFGGIVQYDIPKAVQRSKDPVPVMIEVRAGSETHVFRGTLSKYRK